MKVWNEQLKELLFRDKLPEYLSKHAQGGMMTEVGTYGGDFAALILDNWGGRMNCVDPWSIQPDSEYRDGCSNGGRAGGVINMDKVYEQARNKLKRFGHRVNLVRKTSMGALGDFQDGVFDCVYIDANHSKKTALQDLDSWAFKVKEGGLLGIHDCYIREDEVQRCGVWDAVWEWSHDTYHQPFLTSCNSAWWIL